MTRVRSLSTLLRVFCVAALSSGSVWARCRDIGDGGNHRHSQGGGVETLMVPSGAMGRDIRWRSWPADHTRLSAGRLDAGPDVSNWVTAGNAMNTLAGKGISVVAPAGGAYSMYTNWEQDGSKQWDTFLSSELPGWLAANKGLAPGGHAVVGASQGGYAAMALAAFHPDRFGFAGSLSGFLYPSSTNYNGAILAGMQQFGGIDGNGMWGAPQLAGGSGTTRGCTPRCLRRTTPGSGCTARPARTPATPPP